MLYEHNILFEHYLLLIVSILPFFYKFTFWLYTIQLKEYRWDRLKEYLSTPQGKSAVINIWSVLELPLLLTSLIVFFNEPFEIIIFNVLFVFLLIENLFIFRKIIKKKILKPKLTGRLLLITLILIGGIIFDFYYFISNSKMLMVYPYILGTLLLAPIIIFCIIGLLYPIVKLLKNRKIKKAITKSNKITKPIKIGITGSYGKSSIKEYLSSILEQEGETLKTPENINTELGVSAIVVNKLTKKYKYFIAEMGAYKIGEISLLGKIVNHKHGFLTSIGNQHLGLFGSQKNIVKGKSEITESILKNEGTLYINWNNEEIRDITFNKKLNIIKYGNQKGSDTFFKIIGEKSGKTEFEFKYKKNKTTFNVNLIGNHSIINLSGVIAFCYDIGIKTTELKKYLKNIKSPKNTLNIVKVKKNILIDDSYNLSESGLFAGLEVLNSFEGDKILILDDILELGKKSKKIHYKIGKKIATNKLIDKVLYVGINYKDSFMDGLFDGGYSTDKVLSHIDTNTKKSNILFEGRSTKKYFDNLNNNNV